MANDAVDSWIKIATLLSSSLPLDTIFGDMSASPRDSAQTTMPLAELRQLTEFMVSTLAADGMDETAIVGNLQYSEPFKTNWAHTRKMIADYFKGELVWQ